VDFVVRCHGTGEDGLAAALAGSAAVGPNVVRAGIRL
jgi:hypothetical protein